MKISRFFIFTAFVLFGFQNGALNAQFGGGGPGQSQPPSNATLQRECDRGNAASCGELGQRLRENGKASPKEMKKAAELYKRACDGGDVIGCGDLAQAYLFGDGVAVDEMRAARLSERACNDGNMVGCSILGNIYEQGKAGYTKDPVKALSYFQKACNQSQPRWEFPCKRAIALTAQTTPLPPKGLADAPTATSIINNALPGELGTSIDCVVLLDSTTERLRSQSKNPDTISQLGRRRQLHFEGAINDLYFYKMDQNEIQGKEIFANLKESVNNTEMQQIDKIDVVYLNSLISLRREALTRIQVTSEFQKWAVDKSNYCLSDSELDRITQLKIQLIKMRSGIQGSLKRK